MQNSKSIFRVKSSPGPKFEFRTFSNFNCWPKVKVLNFFEFECWSRVQFSIQIQILVKKWMIISKFHQNNLKIGLFSYFLWKFHDPLGPIFEFWGSKTSIFGQKSSFWVQKQLWVPKKLILNFLSNLKKIRVKKLGKNWTLKFRIKFCNGLIGILSHHNET